LAIYTKKGEERDNKRKKNKRRSHNKVNKQDKRERKRGREEGTKRPALAALAVSTAELSLVDRWHLYHLKLWRHMLKTCVPYRM
jgi:hypothetical protein